MPPKGRARGPRAAAKNTTTGQGGDPEPERFTAGTGPLADSMIAAHGMRVQKLDEDGAPVGEPQHLGDATVSLDARPGDPLDVAGTFHYLPGAGAPDDPAHEMEFSTDDPAAVATVRELTRIPVPTAVIAEWFPSYFRPPGEDQPWNTCKAFLTPQGLYVYRTAPAESETFTTGATPAWYSGVDFAKTAKPVTGYAAMNAGIPIETAAGRVNVQPYPGCGCGHRKLKNWTPSWSRNRISWADAVALADPTAGR
jgi:hypothetical protein